MGTTKPICEAALLQVEAVHALDVDTASLRHEALAGFWAKYHKWLQGGRSITFSFRPRAAQQLGGADPASQVLISARY